MANVLSHYVAYRGSRAIWPVPNVLLFLFGLISSGCMHTWIGQYDYYPPGSGKSAKYTAYFTCAGASGHAYVDTTDKKVASRIWRGDDLLLSRYYRVVAGNLNADFEWDRPDELRIVFLDYGRGHVSDGAPAKELFTVCYVYDADEDQFTEVTRDSASP